MSRTIISDIHSALKEESIQNNVSGWIFTNFHNRDSFTDSLLGIKGDIVSTRRWIYVVLTNGEEIKILHAIEPHSLDALPSSESLVYASQSELINHLSLIAQKYGNTFALLSDENISVISTVDGGFISLLSKCGIQPVTAAPLVQRCKGLLTPAQLESQERAGAILYQTVYDAWQLLQDRFKSGKSISEYEVQQFIMSGFNKNGLVTDHAPIVAFGSNAGNPHYEPSENESAYAREGDIIQVDLWAKENTAEAAYADISWVGIYAHQVPDTIQKCWETLTRARDSVCQLICANSSENEKTTGAFLDASVRKILVEGGYESGLKHRTGHGIDTECHGSGVNLDSVEFPDFRQLLEGSSFSVEPGLYFDTFGLRTEIDVYIQNGKPVISGRKYHTCPLEIPQKNILTIS